MDITVSDAAWRDSSFGESTKGKMHVFFHTTQVKDNFQTAQQKRPIFREKVFITKLVPGDQFLRIDRPIRETDMEEFPVEYQRFLQKKEQVPEGTPIAAWDEISDTQKAEFLALNILTVDQFANLPDSVGNKIMGFNDLRQKAREFCTPAKELMNRLAAQDNEMAELKRQLAELTAQKRGPGRPPNVDKQVENNA